MASKELLEKYHFPDEEQWEVHLGVTEPTGFPRPRYRQRLVHEAMNQYIEEAYFWTIDHLRYDWGFNRFEKLSDIFAASEQSAFFGVSEQRLGLQQDKAAQFLRGVSEMVKALFQLVRELRIMDERIGYYKHTFERKEDQKAVGSEITLKGIWIDQVEGGTKNAASVYGLAQTVGFASLPDIFFRVRADDRNAHLAKPGAAYDEKVRQIMDSTDAEVSKLKGFNEKVKEVLKRKLSQYYMWKFRTYQELVTRRNFTIKYLRQHYDTIKLYIGWIKPYLRNIQRLQLDRKRLDSADLITAFEGATIEIEVLSYKKQSGANFHPVILLHLFYRTRPALSYTQEGYQRGPSHTGKFDMTLRGYVWNEKEIKNYVRMKDEEDMQLLSSINESIKAAMDALGDELKKYLEEGGEAMEKEMQPEPIKRPSALEPFSAAVDGFKSLFTVFGSKEPAKKTKLPDAEDLDVQRSNADAELKNVMFQTSKNYKKLHGMLVWTG